jgi:hypothetical protein
VYEDQNNPNCLPAGISGSVCVNHLWPVVAGGGGDMIYKTFEQWKSGNVLEHGVPRTEYYSEDQLDLVEMGWNYGYDAGRAVEQALDKMADNARELGLDYEPVGLIDRLKNPEDHYEFTDPKKANAVLMSLCQEAADALAAPAAPVQPVPWSQALESVWAEPDDTPPAAQPAVPDALFRHAPEHPQYIEGWNDCRAEMLKGMKP